MDDDSDIDDNDVVVVAVVFVGMGWYCFPPPLPSSLPDESYVNSVRIFEFVIGGSSCFQLLDRSIESNNA